MVRVEKRLKLLKMMKETLEIKVLAAGRTALAPYVPTAASDATAFPVAHIAPITAAPTTTAVLTAVAFDAAINIPAFESYICENATSDAIEIDSASVCMPTATNIFIQTIANTAAVANYIPAQTAAHDVFVQIAVDIPALAPDTCRKLMLMEVVLLKLPPLTFLKVFVCLLLLLFLYLLMILLLIILNLLIIFLKILPTSVKPLILLLIFPHLPMILLLIFLSSLLITMNLLLYKFLPIFLNLQL